MCRYQRILFAALLGSALLAGVGALAQTSGQQSTKADGDNVECQDGTLAPKTADACAGHGGIASHAVAVPESPTVLCRDGTTVVKTEGACANHGGPAGPMSPAASGSSSPGSTQPPTASGASSATSAQPSSASPESAQPSAPAGATAQPERGTGGSSAFGSSATPPAGTTTAPSQPVHGGQTGAKPTAYCRDGTPWYGEHSDAACSANGGVERWLTEAH